MAKTIEMTVTQFAAFRGVSRQAILKAIKKPRRIVGVVSYRKIGNSYILIVKQE